MPPQAKALHALAKKRTARPPLDWPLLIIVLTLVGFGLVMLFSASYTTGYLRMGDSFHYIKQQALCMLIGLGCMYAMSYVDHRFLRRMVVPGYLLSLIHI